MWSEYGFAPGDGGMEALNYKKNIVLSAPIQVFMLIIREKVKFPGEGRGIIGHESSRGGGHYPFSPAYTPLYPWKLWRVKWNPLPRLNLQIETHQTSFFYLSKRGGKKSLYLHTKNVKFEINSKLHDMIY